jgi:hypothetical protein
VSPVKTCDIGVQVLRGGFQATLAQIRSGKTSSDEEGVIGQKLFYVGTVSADVGEMFLS